MTFFDEMEILQGTVLSRRKAPKGLTFLSVQVYPDCSPSVSKLPDSEALSQLVINPESVNSSLLKVCCGCVIRASCSLDSAHKTIQSGEFVLTSSSSIKLFRRLEKMPMKWVDGSSILLSKQGLVV